MGRTFDEITEMPERWAKALELRAQGLKFKAIGEALGGVTAHRARQIVRAATRRALIIKARSATQACVFAAVLSTIAGVAHADPCKAIPDRGPLPSYLAPGSTFSGPVTYVGDGDSLCVALGPARDAWVEVRLADFYAPELSEPGGAEAKVKLARLVMGRRISCTGDHQSFDRIVAWCRLGYTRLGDLMRLSGTTEGGRGYQR